jgi:hypothetical protein
MAGHSDRVLRPSDALPAASRAIHFWPHLPGTEVASTRIRCLEVMAALRRRGWQAALYEPGQAPAPTLVLGKRYDAGSLAHAAALRAEHGTRIVLDLCDNHFYAARDNEAMRRRAELLRAAVAAADLVVVSSAALADVVRAQCPSLRRLEVIDDALDPLAAVHDGGGWRQAVLAAWFARRRVARGRRLLWFGQQGSTFADAGIGDIERIVPALARHHAASPLTLTVLSNGWRAYRGRARGWPFPSLYLPWSAATFGALLRRHDVALIPLTPNPFTLCKTANRALTAFAAGLAVATDRMPAYEELAGAVVVDDWQQGLARLMADEGERRRRLEAARAIIETRHAPAVIGERWERVLALQPAVIAA